MVMQLRFPHANNLRENRADYVVHPSFSVRLTAGTIWVWDAWDDLFLTHEAFLRCLLVSLIV